MEAIKQLQDRCTHANYIFRKPGSNGSAYCGILDMGQALKIGAELPRGVCGQMNACRRIAGDKPLDYHPECLYGRKVIGDYHTHTWLSDGMAAPLDNVRAAVEKGLDEIAITDHALTLKLDKLTGIRIGQWPEEPTASQMPLGQYIAIIKGLKNLYADRIRVLAGVEIDLTKKNNPSLESLDFEGLNQLDFVLFEYLTAESMRQLAEIRKKLKIPAGLAHTDFAEAFKGLPADETARILAANSLFVELNNVNPFDYEKYAQTMKRHGVKFSTASDAHSAVGVGMWIPEKIGLIEAHGLEQQRF